MRGAYGFTVSSRLDAPAEDVWRRVVSVEGMRHELAPPADGGCVVTDEITFVPRLRITGPLSVVRRLFRHRHPRLRQVFGGAVLVEP